MCEQSNQGHGMIGLRRMGVSRIEFLVLLATTMIFVALGCMQSSRARIKARATKSKNNLHHLGKAMKHYEGLGRRLRSAAWENELAPFLEDPKEVMTCPMDDSRPSYALFTGVEKFGSGDYEKIAIVTSDDRVIDIDTKNCKDGSPVVTGDPVARYSEIVLALMYGGAVRSFETDEILPDDNETIVVWWLPDRDHGTICGEVVEIKEKL